MNDILEKVIYMEISEGLHCNEEVRKTKVCELKTAIYGLKICSKRWHEKFTQIANCNRIRLNLILILILYVDDVLIASKCIIKLEEIIGALKLRFRMTDLGEPRSFLGI